MSEVEIRDGKVFLRRTPEERKPLVQRLNRLEGQLRGVRLMIEEDRHCGDELQQIKAVIAALREVGMAIVDQHVNRAAECMVTSNNQAVAMDDIMRVLREAMRL